MPPQHTATVPAQPSPAARTGPPPDPAYRSEATRLLCAGTYLDADFRDAVIDELYVHEERVTAPSSGTDTARVLAHALRARRLEAGWAGAVLLLCVLGVVLGGYAFALFLVPCVLLTLAARLRGGVPGPFRTDHPGSHGVSRLRRLVAGYLRLTGWWLMALYLMTVLAAASGGDGRGAGYEPGYEDYGSTSQSGDLSVPEIGTGAAWAVLLIPPVLVVCVALHRRQVAAVLGGDLRPDVFAAADRADEAERTAGRRFARIAALIRREQHSPLVLYHLQHPFLGAGTPQEAWTLAVELRPRADRKQTPLDNREILRRIEPLVRALAVPAGGDGERADRVRDRLRRLEIDECVFVPVTGLPLRSAAPLEPRHFRAERERAVEEGGEHRRHFLRIRVGAWEQEVVTTVFVRVHTQGRLLVLEIAPHVLRPVKPDFHTADRVAETYRRTGPAGLVLWALGRTPAFTVHSLLHTARGVLLLWRMWTGGNAAAPADGPWCSVRELGGDQEASTFQEMDVSRYLKSIQDRVANGVREALDAAGWQSGEFAQQVVNVSGVYVGSAENSAIAVGSHIDLLNKHTAPAATATATGGSDGDD
ncbi:hypothetical protein V1L54_08340 [Streptomyces sp. TRM 70361]|uniref:hypothetical protein n=1 Tax=Streptomyces sp. TRM 70361 TaxID=3116553 RepID=UPI002E7BB9FC|nr:hypothetical protein [Streptomyces sp. TRM 70361]MEE1939423.1 hypothetical protein [Streptomyces sp. TRM 70361]